MKKIICCMTALGLILLSGCSKAAPKTAADGLSWDENWIMVGEVIGVDTTEGLTPRENNGVLSVNGMYYATWSIGEEVPFVNADGDEAQLYDAQFYVLAAECASAGKAETRAKEWLDMASEKYTVEETVTVTCNGQEFTLITCTYQSETNPYARGASAYGIYGSYAISVELSCQEEFDGSAEELLTNFLEHCHYTDGSAK